MRCAPRSIGRVVVRAVVTKIFPPNAPYANSQVVEIVSDAVDLCNDMLSQPIIARVGLDATSNLVFYLRGEDANNPIKVDISAVADGVVNYNGALMLGARMGLQAQQRGVTETVARAFALSFVFYRAARRAAKALHIQHLVDIIVRPALSHLSDGGRLGCLGVRDDDGNLRAFYLFNINEVDGTYVAQYLVARGGRVGVCRSFAQQMKSRHLVTALADFIKECVQMSGRARHARNDETFIGAPRVMAMHTTIVNKYLNDFLSAHKIPPARITTTPHGALNLRDINKYGLGSCFHDIVYPVNIAGNTIYAVSPFAECFTINYTLQKEGIYARPAMYHYARINLGAIVLATIACALVRDIAKEYDSSQSADVTVNVSALTAKWESITAQASFFATGRYHEETFGVRGYLNAQDEKPDTFELIIWLEPIPASTVNRTSLVFSYTDAFYVSFIEQQVSPPAWVRALRMVGALP